MLRRVSLRIRLVLNLPFPNIHLFHTLRIPLPMESRSNFLLVLKITCLFEKGGEISHIGKPIRKILGSKGVGMKELLNKHF